INIVIIIILGLMRKRGDKFFYLQYLEL
ncbi:hypothetical protein LCGC14_3033850, partial [marine sediment metagenome]